MYVSIAAISVQAVHPVIHNFTRDWVLLSEKTVRRLPPERERGVGGGGGEERERERELEIFIRIVQIL